MKAAVVHAFDQPLVIEGTPGTARTVLRMDPAVTPRSKAVTRSRMLDPSVESAMAMPHAGIAIANTRCSSPITN
jgi:hypothetical protein